LAGVAPSRLASIENAAAAENCIVRVAKRTSIIAMA